MTAPEVPAAPPVPPGVPAEAFRTLLAAGRAHGTITPDDLMCVLDSVELSPELITQVVDQVQQQGIEYVDDTPTIAEAEEAVREAVAVVEAAAAAVVSPPAERRQAVSRAPIRARNAPSTFDDDRGGGSTDFVRMYMRDIGKVPLLTAEQEVSLAERVQAGLSAGDRLMQLEATHGEAAPAEQEYAELDRKSVV